MTISPLYTCNIAEGLVLRSFYPVVGPSGLGNVVRCAYESGFMLLACVGEDDVSNA